MLLRICNSLAERASCVGGQILLQRTRQLIRAGRAAGAALNSLQAGDGLLDLHALHQGGDALRIAHAAADKTAVGNHAVGHFVFDGAAAGAPCLICIHMIWRLHRKK